ncbi:MAG: hypothetical protein H8E72_00965 [Candidatus Marinimicrobia bacterium]|nr:hypothetical protein [Candidatus Neomarinimicrobiota bacterium]
MKNSKLYCYLLGLSDLICFVYGSFLVSLALFGAACAGPACTTCCGCCPQLGLPLIALGFVIRCWAKKCCNKSACCDANDSKA